MLTKILGFALTIVQIAALVVGSYLILSTIGSIDLDREGTLKSKCLDNLLERDGRSMWSSDDDAVYCNYSMYMFTACLVSMTWLFLLLGLICSLYIWYGVQKRQKSKKLTIAKE